MNVRADRPNAGNQDPSLPSAGAILVFLLVDILNLAVARRMLDVPSNRAADSPIRQYSLFQTEERELLALS